MKTNNAKKKKRPVGSLDYKLTAYYFKDNKKFVLVYYEGDETVYVPTHHGNSKKTDSELARTALQSDMISIVNQLLDVKNNDIPFVFFYDTTFKLGDFYVSPQVFRNIIFEEEPINIAVYVSHVRELLRSPSEQGYEERKKLLVSKFSQGVYSLVLHES
ncbi:unnamed protein product [Mytilus edulis]|uniref:Uncharacterized protein n=1 Tax=Mytilus edulis TaxID=6550 RepID=A0A8S3SF98_MYTED|nr:unnamed protein product [Mytilus edulis]